MAADVLVLLEAVELADRLIVARATAQSETNATDCSATNETVALALVELDPAPTAEIVANVALPTAQSETSPTHAKEGSVAMA